MEKSELRAVLADAIRGHILEDGRCIACGESATYQSLHQADVLLRLCDITPKQPNLKLPDFVTVTARTGTSARYWCDDCDWGGGWSSPSEAWNGAFTHVEALHPSTDMSRDSRR